MELDVYLPFERLAFEYQGEHHFKDIHAVGNKWMQQQKDEEKRKMCEQHDITLIEIPHWWDNRRPCLLATIHKYRPDLIPLGMIGDGVPIDGNQDTLVGMEAIGTF